MLQKAIQHLQDTARPEVMKLSDGSAVIIRKEETEQFFPCIHRPDSIELGSLDAVVKMVKTEALPYLNGVSPLYITVPTAKEVKCFTSPDKDLRYDRVIFYRAIATDVPGWDGKTTMDFEEAQIALRTRFQDTPDVLYIQKLLSELTMGAKVTYNDNGIVTTVVTKKGVDLQTRESIRPIVKLRPYRTFQEVAQPVSEFLIRVGERGISFIEADGGMWRLAARNTVKKFLEEALSAEVESGAVVVAL